MSSVIWVNNPGNGYSGSEYIVTFFILNMVELCTVQISGLPGAYSLHHFTQHVVGGILGIKQVQPNFLLSEQHQHKMLPFANTQPKEISFYNLKNNNYTKLTVWTRNVSECLNVQVT